MAGTHVALLRGINVGGKHLVPMKELAALFGELGHTDVKTLLQSGNVVFTPGGPLEDLAPALERRFGFAIPVVFRTRSELADAVARRERFPCGYVALLSDRPTAEAAAALDPDRSPGDTFVVDGREIFLTYVNAARTKLTLDWFEKRLGVRGTVRNWNTVEKLIAASSA